MTLIFVGLFIYRLLREVCLEGDQLTSQEQTELAAVLEAHTSPFSMHKADYGLTSTMMHEPTRDAQLILQMFQPIPPALYQEVKDMLRQMQERQIIRPSWSP